MCSITYLLFCSILGFSQVSVIKLLPSVGNEFDHFGHSVSIDGNYAIVGAHGADKTFIFKKAGTSWIEKDILIGNSNPPGSTLDPSFGYSVCIHDNLVIVGAPFHAEAPVISSFGAAYIYKLIGDNWELQELILPPDGHLFGLFGWSVAISSDFAVIGEAGTSTAYVYERVGENWDLIITLNDGWRFGEDVTISGDFVSIGTVGGSLLNPDGQGSAYIFHHNGVNWQEQAILQASDGSVIDGFGEALSISDILLVAGDAKASNGDYVSTGAAYVYSRSDTLWTEKQKITASDGEFGDLFGFSASISGNYIIIGAPEDQDLGLKSGSAYFFRYDGINWVEEEKFLAIDGEAYDIFGCSVSISGDNAIIGASGNDDYGNSSGSAYIYQDIITDIPGGKYNTPFSISLGQNHPNPFKHSTLIEYTIKSRRFITLKIYDISGNEVGILVSEEKKPGSYQVEFNASGLPGGIYYYKLCAFDPMTDNERNYFETKKMLVLK